MNKVVVSTACIKLYVQWMVLIVGYWSLCITITNQLSFDLQCIHILHYCVTHKTVVPKGLVRLRKAEKKRKTMEKIRGCSDGGDEDVW